MESTTVNLPRLVGTHLESDSEEDAKRKPRALTHLDVSLLLPKRRYHSNACEQRAPKQRLEATRSKSNVRKQQAPKATSGSNALQEALPERLVSATWLRALTWMNKRRRPLWTPTRKKSKRAKPTLTCVLALAERPLLAAAAPQRCQAIAVQVQAAGAAPSGFTK